MKKIKTISAYLCIQPNGEEGIVAQKMDDGWMPFISGDDALIEKLRPVAKQLAFNQPKLKIKLVRFSVREDLESF